ncbi:hypothetical protein N7540_008612 [Penicillium herquei]|nr:hypothetical protein N7540_008612 [Penicillium herquei]
MNYVIAKGDIKMLKLLIERGNSAVHSHGVLREASPLSHALSCKFGSKHEILEILIAAGALIDSEIMGSIISKGSAKVIRMALKRCITFKLDGDILHRTISRSDPDVLLTLLPLIISGGMLNERIEGLSALQRALLHPIPRLAMPLINAGIDLDILDRKGRTALHYALLDRHFDIAIVLISAGCRLNVATRLHGNELHHAIRPNTPLADSDEYDSDENCEEEKLSALLTVVYLLLARGVEVDLHGTIQDDNGGFPGMYLETPLWHAIKCGYKDVVCAILTMGSHRPDLTITDQAGRTPLQFAKERWNGPIIRMLEECEESP